MPHRERNGVLGVMGSPRISCPRLRKDWNKDQNNIGEDFRVEVNQGQVLGSASGAYDTIRRSKTSRCQCASAISRRGLPQRLAEFAS